MKKLLLLFGLIFSIYSCRTDFDLNAPYKISPVVYGLLDQSLDTQFVKINKSFLGDGNNVSYAAINDCTLFDSLIAVIEGYDLSNNLVSLDTLKEINVKNIDDGIFYEDEQKLYFFTSYNNRLDDELTYHLNVNVPSHDLKFGAVTNLVEKGGTNPSFNYLFETIIIRGIKINGIRFIDKVLIEDDNYMDQLFSWRSTNNGERYELVLKFHFQEHLLDGSVISRYLEWNLGTQKSTDVYNNGEFQKTISGSAFYDMVASRLDNYSLESQVVKRTFTSKPVEFVLTIGNDILNTYMEVNEPVTGIVTEKPAFSNINNGIGIFASKFQCAEFFSIQRGTILELCLGPKTSEFKFCYENPSDIEGYNVGCPQ